MKALTLSIAALGLLASTTFAQTTVHLNEIYVSHAGTDDREMIELKGTPNGSLNGFMVLIVEGDSASAGTLDRAYDLAGETIPADGYFVLGGDAVTNVDLKLGATNLIENGTNTIYLVQTTMQSQITALVGTNVDGNGDLQTDIVGLATIVDIIGMADSGITGSDKIYDGAQQLGPDGSFGPAGVFRDGDYPNAWCDSIFLDFSDEDNKDAVRTPGAMNTRCANSSIQTIGDSCLTGAGTTGGPTLAGTKPTIGENFDLTITGAGAMPIGLLYAGVEGAPSPFLGCNLYLNPAVIRFAGTFTFASGTGTMTLPLPALASIAGTQFALQAAVGTATTLHVTNALGGTVGYDQ